MSVSTSRKRDTDDPAGWCDPAGLSVHALAGDVPALTGEEYAALKADINEHGVQVAIEVTPAGVVLDGRARLSIACELRLDSVPTVTLAPTDELEHMLRRALVRRQLSASQRAALAVKLADITALRAEANERRHANLQRQTGQGVERATLLTQVGEPVERAGLPARGQRTRDHVARISGASPRTVQDALTVADHDPALFERVAAGEISVSTAASKVRRALRDAAIPAPAPMPEGPYQLILADPPWSFGSPDSDFAPDQHYPTMPLHEIKALQVPAGEDCVLFLWAVNCLLPQALEVIRAWGFTYRNNLAWIKQSIGPGVWLRQRHELLLIATRGTLPPPEPEDRVDSVIDSPRRKHSQKPDEAYERIEHMYPTHSKLELFARGTPRPGWAIWGNQAEQNAPTNADTEPVAAAPKHKGGRR
jgi:N6-adenosine-specific RNA methylase IME4